MSVSPDDIVRLDGRGSMTAKSAVRIVMQEWLPAARQRKDYRAGYRFSGTGTVLS